MKLFILFMLCLYNVIKAQFNETLQEFNTKREEFYSQIINISNGKLKMENLPGKGLSAISLKDIEKKEILLEVPREFTICNMNLFPFKYEIYEALNQLPDRQLFGHLLLIYQLLYDFYAPKEEIREYIKLKKLEKYYDYHDKSENIKYSFSAYTPNFPYYENSHWELFGKLFDMPKDNKILRIFSTMLYYISNSEHRDYILPWINNFENFRWIWSNILSRAYKDTPESIFELEYFNVTKFEYSHQLNLDFSKKMVNEGGIPITRIICFSDLMNHYQNKYLDLRDKMSAVLYAKNGKLIVRSNNKFYEGKEVENNYQDNPDSLKLSSIYGFLAKDNIFDNFEANISLDEKLTSAQKDLCIKIKCFENEKEFRSKIINRKIYTSTVDKLLLNYARVRLLKVNISNASKYLDLLSNNKIIDYENEIGTWMYYYTIMKQQKENKNVIISPENLIYSMQYYRDIARKIEKKVIDTFDQLKHWGYFKNFEYIYNSQYNVQKVYQIKLKQV